MKTLSTLTFLALLTSTPGALAAEPIVPTRQADATSCELYINTLDLEQWHYGGGGYDEQFMTLYVSVNTDELVDRLGGKILQVGMRLNGVDDVAAAREFEPAYYLLRQSLWERGYETHDYDLHRFAVWVDVERRDGTIDRLWLKDGWHDFDWPAVFDGYPKQQEGRGSQYHQYVQNPSPVYNQRNVCTR